MAGFSLVTVFGLIKQRRMIVHSSATTSAVDCMLRAGEPCTDDFVTGTEFFGKHSDYFTADVQLELYGLYKQATAGDCPSQSSEDENHQRGSKRSMMTCAWLRKSGISSKNAQLEYIRILDESYPPWRQASRFEHTTIDPFLRDAQDDQEDEEYHGKYKSISTWAAGSVPCGVIGDIDDSDDSVGGMVCEIASVGNLIALEELYQRNPNIVQVRDKDGMTPLHWASDRGHVEIVQFLLSHGADVNLQDHCDNTSLHIAAMSGQKDIVRLLLDARADLTIVNCEGESVRDVLKNEFPKIVFS